MKNNLGKYAFLSIYFCILGSTLLHSEDFNYTFHADKKNPYVKEAVLLTLDINQTNPNKVLLFNFDLVKSDDYVFQRVDTKETDTYHNVQIRYIYLIYPLRSGEIDLNFTLLKKATTDESVSYSFSGDRDNVKGLVTVDTPIALPPLRLQVQTLPEHTRLVGDFSLTYTIKKHQGEAHEPLPLQIRITGKGYPPLLNTLLPHEGNFTRFTESPVVSSLASTKGSQSTVTYAMALSAKQSFTLAPIQIKAFNPTTEKSYLLEVPEQYFNIHEIPTAQLVDTIDSPDILKEEWSWLRNTLGYLMVFIAGYLTAVSVKWSPKTRKEKYNPLKEKIEKCNSEKALLQLLISREQKDFTHTIEKLESSLYGDGKINFKRVKQDLLEQIA